MLMQSYKLVAFLRSARLFERNRYLDPAELLFARRACGATDPREIVYAHLRLTNLTSAEIPVDYKISVGELYGQTTKALIRRAGNLDALTAAYPAGREAEMPS
jgi:hypothetical protein